MVISLHRMCHRCDSDTWTTDNSYENFPQCLQCGYVDYKKDIPKAKGAKGIMKGNVFPLYYSGINSNLKGKILHITVTNGTSRDMDSIWYTKITGVCPFCKETLSIDRSKRGVPIRSKKRSGEYKAYRFICVSRHRVYIDLEGEMSWS